MSSPSNNNSNPSTPPLYNPSSNSTNKDNPIIDYSKQQPSSVEDEFLNYIRNHRGEARKSKSVHVITSSCLSTRRFSPSELMNRKTSILDSRDIVEPNIIPLTPSTTATASSVALTLASPSESATSTSVNSLTLERQSQTVVQPTFSSSSPAIPTPITSPKSPKFSIHNSMENIHRPTNFRTPSTNNNPPTTIAPKTTDSKESLTSISNINTNGNVGNESNNGYESDTDNTGVNTDDESRHSTYSLNSINSSSYSHYSDKHLNTNPIQPEFNIYPESSLKLLRPPVFTFMYNGLQVQSRRIKKIQKELDYENLQSASRYILNTLLLNSLRSSRKQMCKIRNENSQLKLQENNLNLQLRVVRHVQTTERSSASEQIREIHELTLQAGNLQKEQKRRTYELEEAEDELNASKATCQKLYEEKVQLKLNMADAWEKKADYEHKLDLEKQNSVKHGEYVLKLESQHAEIRYKIKDLLRQENQWKDRTKECEQLGWILKKTLDSQESEQKNLKMIYEQVQNKMKMLSKEKLELQETVHRIDKQLDRSIQEHDLVEQTWQIVYNNYESQYEYLKDLEEQIAEISKENNLMRPEVTNHKLRYLKRRRFIINGLKSMRYLLHFVLNGPESVITAMAEEGVWSRYF